LLSGVLYHRFLGATSPDLEVQLFQLAMTAILTGGNDLLDNYFYARVEEVKANALVEADRSFALRL